jgi:hypothetical protein
MRKLIKSDKTIAVLFKEGYVPRIFINPSNIEELEKEGTVLINPKIPKGTNPARWYVEKNKIKVLTKDQQGLRQFPINKDLSHLEVDYKFGKQLKAHDKKHRKRYYDLEQELQAVGLYLADKHVELQKKEVELNKKLSDLNSGVKTEFSILILICAILNIENIVTILELLENLVRGIYG